MKIRDYLTENKKYKKMNSKIKNKLNKELSKMLIPTYFRKIPLTEMFTILENNGIIPLQEDNTYWDGMLLGGDGKTEHVSFDLGFSESKDEMERYVLIENARLNMSYYILPNSGKYEIIAYVG